MPVGFNSPARNLFLLGSSGQQVVTNFFEAIDKSASTDGVYIPDEIRYVASNQKYALAGTAADSNSKNFGWFERQDYDLETGSLTTDYSNKIESTQSGVNTTLRAMELDSNDNLIVVGKTGTVPWIAKYTNGGAIAWSSTTNSADVEYFDVASDSYGKYYACGRTPLTATDTQAFIESFDQNGNPGWGKQAFMLGREVTTIAIDANNQGHVVAVGYLEDDTRDKGYIIKIDTATGNIMWDRTLSSGVDLKCTDVFIDSKDQIYVIANDDTNGYLVKYTAAGNMIWQKKTNQSVGTLSHLQVQSDGETEQTIVFGNYEYNGDQSGVLSKYAKDGRLVFRRTMVSSNNNSDTFDNICLDADASFYYFMYTDQTESGFAGTPDAYTFGKVSSSGNGLGAFQYEDGTGTTIDYEILNAGDTIGRLSDGSVRNDTSDLITYPFTANKLVFDDLATHVSNKRRQMDGPDSFEYSGSPAIRPADFPEMNLGTEASSIQTEVTTSGDYVGQAEFTTTGSFSWTVPTGVTSVSVVCVGGGSNAGTGDNRRGGGGGALAYVNNISVTPGEALTVEAGTWGGYTAGSGYVAAGHSDLKRGATILCRANGGESGSTGSSGSSGRGGLGGTVDTGTGGSGGTGGGYQNQSHGGGGGAGGYSGDGGDGAMGSLSTSSTTYSGGTGSGGGGGGGGSKNLSASSGAGGGGVGLYGEGASGAGGGSGLNQPGFGGSGGSDGGTDANGNVSSGGLYGGGAAVGGSVEAGRGAVRIIWGPGRSFPSTLTADQTPSDGEDINTTITTYTALDQSGKGNDGTVNGATLNADGYWEFDGTNDTIDLGTTPLIASNSDFTVEGWCWVDALTNECSIFEVTSDTTSAAILLSAGSTTDGTVGGRFVVRKDSGQDLGMRNPPGLGHSTGEWHHYVGTHINSSNKLFQTKLYVDGVNVQSADTFAGNHDFTFSGVNTQKLGVSSGTRFLDGRIGEFRIYPRALTPTQVFQNYNATKSKYINEAPNTASRITSDDIVIDSNLLLNYDFGNRATYDRAENLIPESIVYADVIAEGLFWSRIGVFTRKRVADPFGSNNAFQYLSGGGPNIKTRLISAPDSNPLQPTSLTGEPYVFSIFVKAINYDIVHWGSSGLPWTTAGTGNTRIKFNLSTGTVVTDLTTMGSVSSASMIPYGGGWWRLVVATTPATDDSGIRLYLDLGEILGDVHTRKEGFQVYGAQMEVGTTVGRHVQTYGTAITPPTTVKNLSSSSYPGTLVSGLTFNSDGHFDFDGVDGRLETTLPASTIGQTFTAEAWIYPTDFSAPTGGPTDAYPRRIMSCHRSVESTKWCFGIDTSGRLGFGGAQGIEESNDKKYQLSLNTYYHVVLVHNGTSYKIYVNGTEQVDQTTSPIDPNNQSNLAIGGRPDGYADRVFEGRIAQARIYNDVLTSTEISKNYNATRTKYGV
jgi:hypothetical protein